MAAAAAIDIGFGALIPWVLGFLGLLVATVVWGSTGQRQVAGSLVFAALIFTPVAFFAAIVSFENERSRASSGEAPASWRRAPATTEQQRAFQAYCGAAPAFHAVAADTPRTLLVRVDDKALYLATGLTSHALVETLLGDAGLCRTTGLVAVESESSVGPAGGGARRWQRMDTSRCTRTAWTDVPEASARYELVVGDRIERTNLSGAAATAISLRINDRVTGKRVAEDTAYTLQGDPMPQLCRHGKEQLARMVSGVFRGHK